jgi:alpha-L-rhamnosidase
MARWVEWRRKNSPGLICSSACFGDWLAIDIAEGDPGRSPTPRDLIATAYFARTAEILARAAAIIGKTAEARKYGTLARQVREAFNREFVSPNGRLAGDTQTAYLLALGFDLLPEGKRAYAAERLAKDIERRKWHLSTGFVGTPLLAPVLTRFGRADAAYKLLLQQTYPSWLYPILQGDATTMWERWNSYTKNKGFGDAGMNSFNHYAYGAIGEWMVNTVAGLELDPEEPGYKHIIIRPQPGGGLTWARAELATRYGKAACSWKLEGGQLAVKAVVPPNTWATVILPGAKPRKVAAGTHELKVRMGKG